MGRTQDQNLDNQPQNFNNNNPQPVEEVPSPSPYNVHSNIDEQINKPSPLPVNQPPYPPTPVNQPYQGPQTPYNVHSNIDEQINKPSPLPINQPPYPPTPVNQPYQGPQTPPPPAYPPPPPPPVQFPPTAPMGDFQGNNSAPVQFPPTSTKSVFQDNNSTPMPFPPVPNHGQQFNQFPQPSQFNQPIPQQVPVPIGVPVGPTFNESWSTELFDCMDDPTNAVTTLFFPCVTFGQIAEIIDNGQTACTTSGLIYGLLSTLLGVGLPLTFIMSCTYRTKLRNKYGLIESPAPDWITHLLCEPCALCQAYRELQNRGLDPTIGWIGNVAKQQQQTVMMAPTYQNMNI